MGKEKNEWNKKTFCKFKYDSQFFQNKDLKYKAGLLDKEMKNKRKVGKKIKRAIMKVQIQSAPFRHTSDRPVGSVQAGSKG